MCFYRLWWRSISGQQTTFHNALNSYKVIIMREKSKGETAATTTVECQEVIKTTNGDYPDWGKK